MPFTRVDQLYPEVLLDAMARVLNSNQNIILDDGHFKIELYVVRLPRGGGRFNRALLDMLDTEMDYVLSKTKSLVNCDEAFHPHCLVGCWLVFENILSRKHSPCKLPNTTRTWKRIRVL